MSQQCTARCPSRNENAASQRVGSSRGSHNSSQSSSDVQESLTSNLFQMRPQLKELKEAKDDDPNQKHVECTNKMLVCRTDQLTSNCTRS